MKTSIAQILLPAIALGGILWTPGCSTPTTTVGAAAKSDRVVLHLSSPVRTRVQCEWRQDGARIEHRNTTPFRLVLPGSSVHAIRLVKPDTAASVAVEVQPAGAAPSRFVMERDSSGMQLVSDHGRWESRAR